MVSGIQLGAALGAALEVASVGVSAVVFLDRLAVASVAGLVVSLVEV